MIMKQDEIRIALWEIRRKIDMQTVGVWFVPVASVQQIHDEIYKLSRKISEEWIQIDSTYEENGIQFCWACNRKVWKMKKSIDKTMVSWLIKAFNHVMENKSQTFMISEINLNKIEYWVLNHLVRFWLLYKSEWMKRWEYWVPRRTVSRFMRWEWAVAKYFIQDPTKKEDQREMSEERIYISQVPSVDTLIQEFWINLVSYEYNWEDE